MEAGDSVMYYYAIREAPGDVFKTVDMGKSYDVTYIASATVPYSPTWLHNDYRNKSRHLSMIEKWEYDMLNVLDIPHITVTSVFRWGSHTPGMKE
jgi:hypothetical protein